MQKIQCPGCSEKFVYEMGVVCPHCGKPLNIPWIKRDIYTRRKKVRIKVIVLSIGFVLMMISLVGYIANGTPVVGASRAISYMYLAIALACTVTWGNSFFNESGLKESDYGILDPSDMNFVWSTGSYETAMSTTVFSAGLAMFPLLLVYGGIFLLFLTPIHVVNRRLTDLPQYLRLLLIIAITGCALTVYIASMIYQWQKKEKRWNVLLAAQVENEAILDDIKPNIIDRTIDSVFRLCASKIQTVLPKESE